MESRLQGKRTTLGGFGDGKKYQGWLLHCSGLNWVVSMTDEVPPIGTKLTVTVHGDREEHVAHATVALVQDQNLVVTLAQPATCRPAACDGRTLVQKMPAVWKAPEGPINVWITDISRSGFGYECDRELPQGKCLDFGVAVKGQFQDLKGEVVHQRLVGAVYKGGVKLVYSTRLMQSMWAHAQ